jgi:hypothetical protein
MNEREESANELGDNSEKKKKKKTSTRFEGNSTAP